MKAVRALSLAAFAVFFSSRDGECEEASNSFRATLGGAFALIIKKPIEAANAVSEGAKYVEPMTQPGIRTPSEKEEQARSGIGSVLSASKMVASTGTLSGTAFLNAQAQVFSDGKPVLSHSTKSTSEVDEAIRKTQDFRNVNVAELQETELQRIKGGQIAGASWNKSLTFNLTKPREIPKDSSALLNSILSVFTGVEKAQAKAPKAPVVPVYQQSKVANTQESRIQPTRVPATGQPKPICGTMEWYDTVGGTCRSEKDRDEIPPETEQPSFCYDGLEGYLKLHTQFKSFYGCPIKESTVSDTSAKYMLDCGNQLAMVVIELRDNVFQEIYQSEDGYRKVVTQDMCPKPEAALDCSPKGQSLRQKSNGGYKSVEYGCPNPISSSP